MSYSFQTFSALEVLGASKMNQIEVNVRDHNHGQNGVGWGGGVSSAFLPVLYFGATPSGTFSRQEGKFSRVGGRIFFNVDMILTHAGSAAGLAYVGGIPIEPSPGSAGTPTGFLYPLEARFEHMTISSGMFPHAMMTSETSIFWFGEGALNGTVGAMANNMTNSSFTNSSAIHVFGSYPVSSGD